MVRAFQILFLIIISSTSSTAQIQQIYARNPIRLYQSNDTQNPELFKKIIFSNSNNVLTAISNKGNTYVDITKKLFDIYTEPNKIFASFGYYNNYTLSLSNPAPFIDSQVLSDSAFSISQNKFGQILFLRGMDFGITNLRIGVARNPVYGTTSIYRSITISKKSKPNYNYTNEGRYKELELYPDFLYWPKDKFIFTNQNGNQQNDFSILNLVAGKDEYIYFTAINDKFTNITSTYRIGGSEIAGTTKIPNIYKFRYASTLDGSFYSPGTEKPSFQLVGQGKLVHIDTLGNLYTIQTDRIIKQAPNSAQTEVVAGGNDVGPAINQLILNVESQQPIVFDSNQNMYLCDYYNERIVYWAKGSKQGKVLISRELNNLTSFKPISIALDQSNNIYVADNFSHSILKFENCTYMYKPIVNQISNEDLTSNFGKSTNWYFNNQLINKENQSNLKPKETGYYQAQSINLNGCLSQRSDSLLFVCKPIKPEVSQTSKFELSSNVPIDKKTYVDFDFTISNYGTVNLNNKSKNISWWSWNFSDGTYSNENIKTFNTSGNYTILLTVGNTNKEVLKLEKQVKIDLPPNPTSNLIANIPVKSHNNIWEDVSGFQNHASFNGKINQLTNRGIETFPVSNSRLISSIKLTGCSTNNLNEVISIPNPPQLKETKAITMSAWFGFDPTLSMNPVDGTCGPNGRQVLFSKGGDGYGTSLPGFNCLIDINNGISTLLLEFSKNSGNFNLSIPISKLIDTTPQTETFEEIYFRDGNAYNSDFKAFFPNIVQKFREGSLEYPFQHLIVSFDESRVLVYLNGKKIADEAHVIPLTEINNQDLYIGALGPKSTPYNGIYNWYPFKGRIDRIKVFSKILNDYEINQLYSEKYINE